MTEEGLNGSGTTTVRSDTKPENVVSAEKRPSDSIRRGSAGVVGSMMLLKSYQNMHAPFTQVAPISLYCFAC